MQILRFEIPEPSITDTCDIGGGANDIKTLTGSYNMGTDEINALMRADARGDYSRWLEYTDEPLVSSDVVGNSHSAVFDSLAKDRLV